MTMFLRAAKCVAPYFSSRGPRPGGGRANEGYERLAPFSYALWAVALTYSLSPGPAMNLSGDSVLSSNLEPPSGILVLAGAVPYNGASESTSGGVT